jgi:hypothetical protein
MSDLSILTKARMEGVGLSLNPDGTLRAIGAAEVLASLRPALLSNKPRIIAHLKLLADLERFRFDLVKQDIVDGASAEELRRTNNLCWHLMQADGLVFTEAMEMAAEIVVSCPPAEFEAGYDDPHEIWRRLVGDAASQPDSSRNLQEVA